MSVRCTMYPKNQFIGLEKKICQSKDTIYSVIETQHIDKIEGRISYSKFPRTFHRKILLYSLTSRHYNIKMKDNMHSEADL